MSKKLEVKNDSTAAAIVNQQPYTLISNQAHLKVKKRCGN